MKFPKEFFEGEEREGFYIEPMMKRNWAAQIEVLKKISDICDKYNLKYFALWGTLLGAIRHKGYVPWDDDLDIGMLREDYDRFFEVAKQELPSEYKVLSIYSEPEWDLGIGRITNYDGIILSQEKLQVYHGCPFSVGVDIFPYDPIPDDEETREYQDNIMDLINKIEMATKYKYNETGKSDASVLDDNILAGLSYIEKQFGFTFNKEVHLVNQLDCLYDQISGTTASPNSTFVTCYMEKLKRENDFKMPTYWLSETIDVPFECTTIKVPKYYEAVLSVCYGASFMTPIKSGIAGHGYPAYKDQITFMEERGFDKKYEAQMKVYTEEYLDEEYNPPAAVFLSNCSNDDKLTTKNVLCGIGIADVYTNEEHVVKKVEDTLKWISSNNSGVNIYFTINPLIADLLYWKDENLLNKLNEALIKYDNNDKIKFIEYDQILNYIDKMDAYYGTTGELVKFFTINNKPVMIHNCYIYNTDK